MSSSRICIHFVASIKRSLALNRALDHNFYDMLRNIQEKQGIGRIVVEKIIWLFVELHELKSDEYTHDLEWRQMARWIKYEEDVEIGPDHWGKPHVPPLCFTSVSKLRQCMEAGSVMLDLEENDLMGIITRIVDDMVQGDQIQPELREKVLQTLILRHRHVNEKHLPLLRRNSASYGNLNLLGHDKRRSSIGLSKPMRSKSLTVDNHILNNGESATPAETAILMDGHEMNTIEITPAAKSKSFSIDKEKTTDPLIRKRVPENAEGVAVLVGQLPELEKPASTFVRLAEGKLIQHFLEGKYLPLKTRIIIKFYYHHCYNQDDNKKNLLFIIMKFVVGKTFLKLWRQPKLKDLKHFKIPKKKKKLEVVAFQFHNKSIVILSSDPEDYQYIFQYGRREAISSLSIEHDDIQKQIPPADYFYPQPHVSCVRSI